MLPGFHIARFQGGAAHLDHRVADRLDRLLAHRQEGLREVRTPLKRCEIASLPLQLADERAADPPVERVDDQREYDAAQPHAPDCRRTRRPRWPSGKSFPENATNAATSTPIRPSPTIMPEASSTPSCLVASGLGARAACAGRSTSPRPRPPPPSACSASADRSPVPPRAATDAPPGLSSAQQLRR